MMNSGCLNFDLASLFDPELEEHLVKEAEKSTRNKILMIDISGVITSETLGGGLFSEASATPEKLKRILSKAAEDSKIKAIILRIDSPGGEVTASDIMYHDLKKYKEKTGIPIYTSMMSIACSGGYYIACASDKIYTHPTTVTGSIGVIARFPNMKGLADKIGYREEVIKSGGMKAIGHPLVNMSPEEKEILQNMINEMYENFLSVVAENRPGLKKGQALRKIADGRIYTAKQAVKLKLTDGIAYLDDVIDKVIKENSLSAANVISYIYGRPKDNNIYSKVPMIIKNETNIMKIGTKSITGQNKPGFYYIWSAGE